MTFEVRCKTPFGPFSNPELLDLKAPPAVHTAQGRIAAWNKEHNLDVAEQHVGARQPTRGKAGPAQYEALLQEILISTGSAQIPASQPSHKRLACHVTLLKQLLQAGVFGPLQAIMEAILDELLNTALSPQVAADPATGTEKLIASHGKEIHRVPYYQLAAQAEQRLVEQQKQSSQALHDQAAAAAAAGNHAVAALRHHHQAEEARLQQQSEEVKQQLQEVQQSAAAAELLHASAVARHLKILEAKEKELQQRQEHLEDLQARLDRVHKAQQEAEDEEEVLQQLKLACILPEEQQRETTGLHHLSEALVLEQQLGVLLNAKLDEYEESKGCGSSDKQAEREHARFRSEADAVMQQLVALKQYVTDHTQTESPCTSIPDASATQPSSEPLQPTQATAELSSPSLRAIVAARTTPHPSVASELAGPVSTALASSDQTPGAQGTECSTSSLTRHKSLDAVKSVGVVESWQVVDADADVLTVWDKYEEVFYGDYHPVSSTFRRMTLPRLKSLLVAWASEKSLHQLVLSDECLLDHFFRYLEETYGCGHLAAHVAHACIMAFDEYVGQDRSVLFTIHCLAGSVPEPVRYYCTNLRCILEAQDDTVDPVRLLRGLYRSARPEELSHVASGCSGQQLLPHVLKGKLVDQIMEHVITGQEIQQRKWCEKVKTSPHRRKEQWDREDFVNLCVHTFSGDTDSLVVALCDAVAPDENEWEVSDSIMAYIMCCLEVAEMHYDDEQDV